MRGLPFFKAKNKPQFAGLNFSDASSSGGGGGGGSSVTFGFTVEETEVGTYEDKKLYCQRFDVKSGASTGYGPNTQNKLQDDFNMVGFIPERVVFGVICNYTGQQANFPNSTLLNGIYKNNSGDIYAGTTFACSVSSGANPKLFLFYTK